MRLQKFPILALAAVGVLSGWTPAFGHGHGGVAGGRVGGARIGGTRIIAGPRGFAAVGPRGFVAGRTGFRHPMVGERFRFRGHFAPRRFFNNGTAVAVGGYGGYPYYPYAYGNPYAYPGYATTPYAYAAASPEYVGEPPVGYGDTQQQCPTPVAGDVVGNVQRVLKYRGFYRGPIDGLSGPTTRAAIRAYDASVGLPPTGAIDARLLLSMGLM